MRGTMRGIDRPRGGAAVLATLLLATACSSAYYGAWEQLGREKRDLLRRHVEAVKDEQQATGEQFEDALERLRAVYGSSGSDLERRYDALRAEYEDAEARADALRARIRRARTTAGDLFDEWSDEIGTMQDAALKRRSRQQLDATKARWRTLDAAMTRSEKSMDPVLARLRDQVLAMKHSLNAQALGTLEGEVGAIDRDVDALVADLRRSSAEADAFLAALGP
jgi:chromosome segregation ATPase